MKREIITTADGSKTISLPDINENYHSTHGALQEAKHVFIEAGLKQRLSDSKSLSILEIGFGSGLNAILTVREVNNLSNQINYVGLEAFPVDSKELEALDYLSLENLKDLDSQFQKMHSDEAQYGVEISSNFNFKRVEEKLHDWQPQNDSFDIIYFDAFGPRVQPELWTEEVFYKLNNSLKEDGFLVTYCAQGQMKRNLKATNFKIECIPGPPGKREMTRAFKISR